MELVDTHCHLQFENYPEPGKVIAAAAQAGVKKMICVGTELHDSEQAVKLAMRFDNVWAAVGCHPHEAEWYTHESNSKERLKSLLSMPKVVAVGEIGLDFYRNISSQNDQKSALQEQLKIAIGSKLPIIFHVREAWEDFWPIYDEFNPAKAVIHSFSAGPKQLREIMRRDLYVGLNGIMTFSRDLAQLEAAKQVPLNRLMLETDAPFLTPAPNRDELCEPRHIRTIAEFLSELRGDSLEKLAAATTANAKELFGI